MKKIRDAKFLIYQSLYIFVICVISLKGANIDLAQVIEDDGKPKVILTPEQMDSIQKRLEYSLIVDTTEYVVVHKSLLAENEDLRRKVESIPKIDPNLYQPKGNEFTKDDKTNIKEKIEEQEPEGEIIVGDLTLFQYHNNVIPNRGNAPITIKGVTINPHTTKKVLLGGEQTVIIQSGDISRTLPVLENKKPQINIQRMTSMNEDTRVSTLQSMTCFRVTINDDFPEQLDVKFSGGVTVSKRDENTYDVRLNFFGSRQAFENYTEKRDSPYSVGFIVTVTDRIAGHKQTGQQSFVFGEW